MKRKYFPNAWFLMSVSVLFACACSGSKPQQSASPSEKMEKEKNGPQQEPFKKCDAMDSECEEGASSDLFHGQKEAEIFIDLPAIANLDESKEQALFVTPIVVEAVKMQTPSEEPSVAVKEPAIEKEEAPSETAAAPSLEQAS